MLLTVYGAHWCPDFRFAEKALAERGIPYSFVCIETLDKENIERLVAANNGEDWATPTFFAHGKYFACPVMNNEIFQKVLDFYQLG